MYRSEMFREHWATLIPKVREFWPNLTEQEVQGINGDVDLLVKKVSAKYGIDREEILNKLAAALPEKPTGVPADKVTAGRHE